MVNKTKIEVGSSIKIPPFDKAQNGFIPLKWIFFLKNNSLAIFVEAIK